MLDSRRLSNNVFSVCLATAVAEVRRTLAYTIEIVRWPLYPLVYYLTLLLTYRISGRESVQGLSPEAFLLVGAWGMVIWSSVVWVSGYAIERERSEGTILSLFLTPASRGAVIFGYAAGSLVAFVAPTMFVLGVLAFGLGAGFRITDPLAVAISAGMLLAGAAAMSYLLAGGFVLTRRANMIANFIQSPIYLLSGMVVPIEQLPGPLQLFATIFPLSAGMDALRESLFAGASITEITGDIGPFAITTMVIFGLGHILLGRVEHAAKQGGQFDFE